MLKIGWDESIGSLYIEFEAGTAGYARELDNDRIVDYSMNPGKPIGVCLHNVKDGVNLDGLPRPDLIQKVLMALDISFTEPLDEDD